MKYESTIFKTHPSLPNCSDASVLRNRYEHSYAGIFSCTDYTTSIPRPYLPRDLDSLRVDRFALDVHGRRSGLLRKTGHEEIHVRQRTPQRRCHLKKGSHAGFPRVPSRNDSPSEAVVKWTGSEGSPKPTEFSASTTAAYSVPG